jgi:hypothetical protein
MMTATKDLYLKQSSAYLSIIEKNSIDYFEKNDHLSIISQYG